MKVEIDCVSKYPMQIGKYERYEALFLVLDGDKSKTKKVTRKTWDSAYAIAKKWYDNAISDGIEVRVGMGITF